jgi:hypothetical protein
MATSSQAEPGAVPGRATRGHVQTYASGRTCSEPGCVTTLSRYNKDDRCWSHAGEARERRGHG